MGHDDATGFPRKAMVQNCYHYAMALGAWSAILCTDFFSCIELNLGTLPFQVSSSTLSFLQGQYFC